MTFEDEIKPIHWQDMLTQMAEAKFRWLVRFGIFIGSFLATLTIFALSLFAYAVVVAVMKKGLDGMLAEPWIPIYAILGLITSVLAVFYLAYDKRLISVLNSRLSRERNLGN